MLLPGAGGGGALKAEGLNRAARGRGEYERGVEPPSHIGDSEGLSRKYFKIYVSENAFQAILSPFFPYSINSILSKVYRHSKTLFFAINFALPCHLLGALVRLCYFIVALLWPTKYLFNFFLLINDCSSS